MQCIICATIFIGSVFAQNGGDENYQNNNSVFLELLGSIPLYSLNYERIYQTKRNFYAFTKLGIGFFPFYISGFSDYKSLDINIESGILCPKRNHMFEGGLGFTYRYLYEPINNFGILEQNSDLKLLVPRIGYRYYFNKTNLFIKIGITPLILLDKNEKGDKYPHGFVPFGGIGIGYCF